MVGKKLLLSLVVLGLSCLPFLLADVVLTDAEYRDIMTLIENSSIEIETILKEQIALKKARGGLESALRTSKAEAKTLEIEAIELREQLKMQSETLTALEISLKQQRTERTISSIAIGLSALGIGVLVGILVPIK